MDDKEVICDASWALRSLLSNRPGVGRPEMIERVCSMGIGNALLVAMINALVSAGGRGREGWEGGRGSSAMRPHTDSHIHARAHTHMHMHIYTNAHTRAHRREIMLYSAII